MPEMALNSQGHLQPCVGTNLHLESQHVIDYTNLPALIRVAALQGYLISRAVFHVDTMLMEMKSIRMNVSVRLRLGRLKWTRPYTLIRSLYLRLLEVRSDALCSRSMEHSRLVQGEAATLVDGIELIPCAHPTLGLERGLMAVES